MVAERKQKKRLKTTPRTPKKPKAPERHLIGSSSTWNEDQLELLIVRQGGQVDPKALVPEKWFEFADLERYQSGIYILLFYSYLD